MRRRSSVLLWGVCALTALPATVRPAEAGVLSGNCRVAGQPAATLLVPFFEADLDNPSGPNTLVSVNNASAKPGLARVVLWTDWGIPTLAFDIYLTGYDVQTLNLRDLLLGSLPATGVQVSPRGSLSESADAPAGCAGAPAPLTPNQRGWIRAAHTGRPLPGTSPARCAGHGGRPAQLASGYVTIDTVRRCSPAAVGTRVHTPADPQYFGAPGVEALADTANVLWGDVFYVESGGNQADSETAVAIVADPDFFSAGDYTFYGRFVGFDGRDKRAPLSSLYYARYLDGGPFSGGTDLLVWRDTRESAPAPRACGVQPSWQPLGELQMVVFDEEENPQEIPQSNIFPLAAQKVHVGGDALPVTAPFGWAMVDLWHGDGAHAQGYVTVRMTAEGRFSAGHAALRADDLCNFGL
jgi:hypothetical protein